MRSVQQIHRDGARRFCSPRWSQMVLTIIEALSANGVNPHSQEGEALVAELAWSACIQAWGAETAHSADVPCSRQSAGVIVFQEGNLLLVERLTGSVGVACPAGHVEIGESSEQAAIRETWEETGVRVGKLGQVAQGRRYERCKRMESDFHDWHVYLAQEADFTHLRHNPTESKRVLLASPEQVAFFARRTEEHLEHLISDEDFRSNPGFERVWFFWLLRAGYIQLYHLHGQS